MISDAEIVRSIIDGDRESFALLVARHESAVWATAWRVLRDDHAASDVAQEAFLLAFRGLVDLRDPSRFEPDTIDDSAFAAAVRRGPEDLREFDKLGDVFLGGPSQPE